MKEAAGSDLSVGGPGLAAHALRAGIVDRLHFTVVPFVVGGGTRALPDDLRAGLELVDERRFGSGVVHLHYRVGSPDGAGGQAGGAGAGGGAGGA